MPVPSIPEYDRWLITHALRNRIPTISATGTLTALHQTDNEGNYAGHHNRYVPLFICPYMGSQKDLHHDGHNHHFLSKLKCFCHLASKLVSVTWHQNLAHYHHLLQKIEKTFITTLNVTINFSTVKMLYFILLF